MAIRDRVRRALGRSSSSESLSNSDSNTTSSNTTNTSQSSLSDSANSNNDAPAMAVTKTATNLTQSSPNKLFPWTSSSEEKQEKETRKREKRQDKERERRRKIHPSQRPLTVQNIQHQKMLSHFTMTFGATKFDPESGSFQGVSPCCTRPGSIIDVDIEHDEDVAPDVHRSSIQA